jgi:uncharacterized protein (TIGR00251 family)
LVQHDLKQNRGISLTITCHLKSNGPTVTFNIRVRANASNNHVGGTAGDPPRLIVAVIATAVDGKANSAIIKELAKAFGLSKRDVLILSGDTSRDKRIQVTGYSAEVSNSYEELCGGNS